MKTYKLHWKLLKQQRKKLDAGTYKVEAIPDMAEYSMAKRFDYLVKKKKEKK